MCVDVLLAAAEQLLLRGEQRTGGAGGVADAALLRNWGLLHIASAMDGFARAAHVPPPAFRSALAAVLERAAAAGAGRQAPLLQHVAQVLWAAASLRWHDIPTSCLDAVTAALIT